MTPTDRAVREALTSLSATLSRVHKPLRFGPINRVPLVGIIPQQDVDANAPGYSPGISREAK